MERPNPELQFERMREFGSEFFNESDRGCAVLVVCVLEELLRKSLCTRLSMTDKELKTFVPPGSLKKGVDLAYALGLISKYDVEEWQKVLTVRNTFAHQANKDLSFEKVPVSALIDRLHMASHYTEQIDPHAKRRDIFLLAASGLYLLLAYEAEAVEPIKRLDPGTVVTDDFEEGASAFACLPHPN